MPKSTTPRLFVVDGSNIATEGRSQPSLEQLNDAVLAFLDERSDVSVTVVVDATFGHRIAKKEVKAFDEAVANNELVTPPAGAIGRGDAFVLSIANKAGAGVLSNDSFQEFHGDYEWLFDEGRLVGGKPVPHVGWVFVDRTPVRGPKSRRAVKEAEDGDKTASKRRANRRVTSRQTEDSAAAEQPSRSGGERRGRSGRSAQDVTGQAAPPSAREPVNDLMPFLEFVERHPVGTSCTAQVESYASHGAYARIGDVLIYIPLRLMDDPTPRSARSVLKIGEAVAVVIVGFTPDRRSIDAAMPHMASGSATAEALDSGAEASSVAVAAEQAPAKKSPAKKAPAKKSPAKKSPAKKSPAKKAPAKKSPARKAPARKSPAKKAPAKKSPAKKSPAKKAPAKKAPAKQSPAKKAPARKSPAKQAPAKKRAPAKQAVAKQVGA